MPDQPELRQRLSDALHEHEMLECSWGVEPNDCNCGHGEKIDINDKHWGRGWSDHVADVLLALPGIAIVALPEAAEGGVDWPTIDGHTGVWINPLTNLVRHHAAQYDAEGARAVAAALLAAAGVAEEQTNA